MAREPHNAVRGVDQAVWKRSVTLAANQGITHGQYVTKALRAQELADQEPIGVGVSVESAPRWSAAPLTITDLDAWSRVAQFRASLRGKSHHGKITQAEQKAFRRAYDAAIKALCDAPSYTPPPGAAVRAIADDLHLDAGNADAPHPQRLGRSAR